MSVEVSLTGQSLASIRFLGYVEQLEQIIAAFHRNH